MNEDAYFADVEKKTNVSKDQILQLVRTLNGHNLKDEATIRQLIHKVAQLSGKKIDKTQEDKILKAVLNEHFK